MVKYVSKVETTFLPEAKIGVFFLILAAIICFIGDFFDGIYSAVDIVIDEKPLLFTNYMLLYTTSFGLEIYGWYKIKNAVND